MICDLDQDLLGELAEGRILTVGEVCGRLGVPRRAVYDALCVVRDRGLVKLVPAEPGSAYASAGWQACCSECAGEGAVVDQTDGEERICPACRGQLGGDDAPERVRPRRTGRSPHRESAAERTLRFLASGEAHVCSAIAAAIGWSSTSTSTLLAELLHDGILCREGRSYRRVFTLVTLGAE